MCAYNDAAQANIEAAKIDEDYIKQCNAQGFYPASYYPHNIHFLWSAASMQGQSKVAIEAARKLAANVRLEQIQQFPTVEFFHTVPLLALVQFGHWDEILAEPQPSADLAYSNAIWRYARGVALARKGDVLVAWSLDRIGRSLSDLVLVSEYIGNRGAQIRCLRDNFDTKTAMGGFYFHLMAALAELGAGLIALSIIGIPFSIAMLRYLSTAYWLGKVNW